MFAPVTPPGVAGNIRIEAPQRHLVVTFSSVKVASILETDGEDLGAVHDGAFRDPLLSQLCLSLWRARTAPSSSGALFEEHALASLVIGLARHGRTSPPVRRVARPLSPSEWDLIDTFIGDRLESDLTLATLSGLVQMTPTAFLRSFKMRAGCPPHQYVLQRRIAHARTLLERTDLALADVALRAWFADQAHMTSTFSRLTGITPGRIRGREATRS